MRHLKAALPHQQGSRSAQLPNWDSAQPHWSARRVLTGVHVQSATEVALITVAAAVLCIVLACIASMCYVNYRRRTAAVLKKGCPAIPIASACRPSTADVNPTLPPSALTSPRESTFAEAPPPSFAPPASALRRPVKANSMPQLPTLEVSVTARSLLLAAARRPASANALVPLPPSPTSPSRGALLVPTLEGLRRPSPAMLTRANTPPLSPRTLAPRIAPSRQPSGLPSCHSPRQSTSGRVSMSGRELLAGYPGGLTLTLSGRWTNDALTPASPDVMREQRLASGASVSEVAVMVFNSPRVTRAALPPVGRPPVMVSRSETPRQSLG